MASKATASNSGCRYYNVPCRFYPDCSRGDSCWYFHPVHPYQKNQQLLFSGGIGPTAEWTDKVTLCKIIHGYFIKQGFLKFNVRCDDFISIVLKYMKNITHNSNLKFRTDLTNIDVSKTIHRIQSIKIIDKNCILATGFNSPRMLLYKNNKAHYFRLISNSSGSIMDAMYIGNNEYCIAFYSGLTIDIYCLNMTNNEMCFVKTLKDKELTAVCHQATIVRLPFDNNIYLVTRRDQILALWNVSNNTMVYKIKHRRMGDHWFGAFAMLYKYDFKREKDKSMLFHVSDHPSIFTYAIVRNNPFINIRSLRHGYLLFQMKLAKSQIDCIDICKNGKYCAMGSKSPPCFFIYFIDWDNLNLLSNTTNDTLNTNNNISILTLIHQSNMDYIPRPDPVCDIFFLSDNCQSIDIICTLARYHAECIGFVWCRLIDTPLSQLSMDKHEYITTKCEKVDNIYALDWNDQHNFVAFGTFGGKIYLSKLESTN